MRGHAPAPASAEDGFLTVRFHEFYRELLELKNQVTGQGDWLFAAEAGEGGGTASPGTAPPNAVWQRLLTLLERQALAARGSGGDLAASIYSQAQYLMAALADEIFLHLDWPGREVWKTQLLEARLFKSHSAGETVFERLDELLANPDPIYLELARLYLASLALGFRGKYRDLESGELELASYRGRLLLFIHRQEATLLEGRERLFPEAYASTYDRGKSRRLPYLRRWLIAALLLLGLWILGSHAVWWELTRDLEPTVERILRGPPDEQEPPF